MSQIAYTFTGWRAGHEVRALATDRRTLSNLWKLAQADTPRRIGMPPIALDWAETSGPIHFLPRHFWHKVLRDPDGCWIWQGNVNRDGYGRFSHQGRKLLAHRAAYMSLVGQVPEGLQLDHLCRVRNCVNPAHLEPVTAGENVRRGVAARSAA